MTKTRVVFLCVFSSVLTFLLTLSTQTYLEKVQPTSISVTGPTTANSGDMVEYTCNVQNPPWLLGKVVYQWQVMDKAGPVAFKEVSPGDIVFPAGTSANHYWVVCSVVGNYNYVVRSYTQPLGVFVNKTVVGSPTPIPIPPIPTPPTPAPTPVPVTEHLFAIAVFDNTQMVTLPASQVAVKTSQTLGKSLQAFQTQWTWRDKSDPAVTDAGWQAKIQQVGVPSLFVVNDAGKIYFAGKLPINESDVVNQVKSVRSGK